MGSFAAIDFCNGGRTGESFILFLLSKSDGPAINVSLFMIFWVGFLGLEAAVTIGFEVGGDASSSLDGTSKTLALLIPVEGDLWGEAREMLLSFFGSAGTTLGDLDGNDSICFLSGACDFVPKL
jgi:hypothetical protein